MTNRTNRSYPAGPVGVAATAAIIGALIGLLLPMAWIEEASWQLYLDRLVAAAAPPLGPTARFAAAALLGLGLGALGWLMAIWLRVSTMAGGLNELLARIRGDRADDEPDAPALRPLDRHPDAPARRPFSAARDVPVDHEPLAFDADIDDMADDELLLDAHFDADVAAEPDAAPQPVDWDDLDHVDVADQPLSVVEDVVEEPAAEPVTEPASPVAEPVNPPVEAAAPPPMDLSIARLDELIARLEAGLSRRADIDVEGPITAADLPHPATDRSAATRVDGDGDSGVIVQNDGDVPHDPALAAALATLRRMNRNS
jgi:hypothetical protein